MNKGVFKQNKFLWLLTALLGVGFLLLLLLLVKKGLAPKLPRQPAKGKAVFSLTASSPSVKVNQTFTVEISLTSNGEKITAADTYLTYDPNILEVASLTSGKLFAIYPNLKVKKLGQVLISGLNRKASEFAQDGVFAKIEFRAKRGGRTKISLTKDSVAAFEGRNVLNSTKLPSLIISVQ